MFEDPPAIAFCQNTTTNTYSLHRDYERNGVLGHFIFLVSIQYIEKVHLHHHEHAPLCGYCNSPLSFTMKNTSNLSFLLCISSVVMPAIFI
jgi:hypothetical protein